MDVGLRWFMSRSAASDINASYDFVKHNPIIMVQLLFEITLMRQVCYQMTVKVCESWNPRVNLVDNGVVPNYQSCRYLARDLIQILVRRGFLRGYFAIK